MKNRLTLFAAFVSVSILFLSCKQTTEPVAPGTTGIQPLPALTISWDSTNSIVCFGTSLTYGYRSWIPLSRLPRSYGANSFDYMKEYLVKLSLLSVNVDSSYPRYLATRLKINVYNEGYVGATTNKALQVIDDSVLARKPALVLLEFGADDFFQHANLDSVEAHMNILVGKIQAYGSAVVLLSFYNPDMVNRVPPEYQLYLNKDTAQAYYTMLHRVAANHSIEIMEYPLFGIFGDAAYMSDFVHPNGLGYKKMEENIFAAMDSTFSRSGMLK